METLGARFAAIELYFSDLKKARAFYADTLGLQIQMKTRNGMPSSAAAKASSVSNAKALNHIPRWTRPRCSLKLRTFRRPSARSGSSVLSSGRRSGPCFMILKATTFYCCSGKCKP
ncbi:MAG: hypothetical protein ACRD72_08910 [Candidatus Angelobacter sp.]